MIDNKRRHTEGLLLLEHIINDKSFKILQDYGIEDSDFFADAKQVYKFLYKFKEEYGIFPNMEVVLEETGIKFPQSVPLEYSIDRFRKDLQRRALKKIFEEANKTAYSDPEKCIANIKQSLKEIKTPTHVLSFKNTPEERLQEYVADTVSVPQGIEPAWPKMREYIDMYENGSINAILGVTSTGKKIADSEPVLTEFGWRRHGDLKIGDRVYGQDGKLTNVTNILNRSLTNMYKVTFNDGTYTRCCKGHLWKVYTEKLKLNNRKYRRDNFKLMTLEDIMKEFKREYLVKSGTDKGRYITKNLYHIPLCKPMEFEEKVLDLDPYMLGLLLGDGSFTQRSVRFVNSEKDILQDFEACCEEHHHSCSEQQGVNCKRLYASVLEPKHKHLREYLHDLDLLGCGSREKFIPKDYIYSSISQRRELLSGLLNTDGSVCKEMAFRFSSYSEKLAKGVVEIARSLGYFVTYHEQDRTSETSTKKYDKEIQYDVRICGDFSELRLSEKHRSKLTKSKDYTTKTIVNIEPDGQEWAQCITVDNGNHLYIVRDYIVTHNCVPETELCTIQDGSRKTIKEVVDNKLSVVSYNFKTGRTVYKTPSNWFYSGKKVCVELTYKSGDIQRVSETHPMLTENGFIEAAKIPKGTKIARVCKLPAPKPTTATINDAEMVIIGALMADGAISGRSEITYTKQDKQCVSDLLRACRELKIPMYMRPCDIRMGKIRWRLGLEGVRNLFKKYNIELLKSNQKYLPDSFFRLPNKTLKTFVSYFWSHDGSVSESGYHLTLSSERLIDDFRHILLRFGIFSLKTKINRRNHWRIVVPSMFDQKFKETFHIARECPKHPDRKGQPFQATPKNNSFENQDSDDIFWDRLENIKYIGMLDTYDLSIDTDHVFECGYTLVHNSWLSCVTAQDAAFRQTKKVLLVTMENPKKSMLQRLEALYHKIPFGDLKKGLVDFRLISYWKQGFEKLAREEGDIWVVDGSEIKRIADLKRAIDSVEPEFVIIDGAYKMQSSVNATGYAESSEVLASIENTAKEYNVPILGTSQLNEEAMKTTGGRQTAFKARFNREWLMNPSSVVCLVQDDDDTLFNRVKCIVAKSREVGDALDFNQYFYLKSDRTRMDFSEIRDDYVNVEGINSLL